MPSKAETERSVLAMVWKDGTLAATLVEGS